MPAQGAEDSATAQSYWEICQELGCQPAQSFLDCLRMQSRICKLASINGDEQMYATTTMLPYANLEELDLSGLQLAFDGWCALLEACSKCTGLKVLSIKGCALGALGDDAQERVARQLGSCSVSVLDASENRLGDRFATTLSRSALLRQAETLTVLDLSENAIGNQGAAALAGALESAGLSCSLKQLDFSFNKLGDTAARAMAAMLSAVPLLALELEGNQITDAGGLAVAAALKNVLCLQRLNLNHNRLSSSTLSSIADALKVNPGTLQDLAVAGTSGMEHGIAMLMAAACNSKQLRLLDVRGVAVHDEAVDALCQLLCSPCPLVTLRLDVGTKEAAETIAQALPGNHSLLHLMMGGCVPEHVLSFVAATLSANTLTRMQQSRPLAFSSKPPPPGEATTPPHQQQQQRYWSPNGPGSGSPLYTAASSGSSARPSPGGYRSCGSSTKMNLSPQQQLQMRAASSGCLIVSPPGVERMSSSSSAGSSGGGGGAGGSGGAGRRGLVRTLTGQARRASALDPTGLAGLSGGGAANKAAEVFKRHDSDNSGYLDAEEMMSALQELGMLEGMRARQLGKFLSEAIKEADSDRDGRVSLEEFTKYYQRLARYYAEAARQGRISARRKLPMVPLEAPANDALKRLFRSYCRLPIGQGRQVGGSVQQINAAQFNQMCRDAGLLEPRGLLSQCAVDIIFMRSKPAGSRRLAWKEFLQAVTAVADEAGVDFAATAEAICRLATPVVSQDGAAAGDSGGLKLSARGSMASSGLPGRNSLVSNSLGSFSQTRLSIRDLTDRRVGPCLPGHNAGGGGGGLLGHAGPQGVLSVSCDSGLLAHAGLAAAGGRGSSVGVLGGVGGSSSNNSTGLRQSASAGVWGTRASSPCLTSPRSGTLTPGSVGEGAGHHWGPGQLQQQQPQQQQPRQQQQQQQQQQAGQLLTGTDTVQNPLFEGDSEGGAAANLAQAQALEMRLVALEGKMNAAAGGSSEQCIPAARPEGDLLVRLQQLETAADDQRQKLSTLMAQQDQLQSLVSKMVGMMEAAGLAASSNGTNQLQHLGKEVQSLSCDVVGLRSKLEGDDSSLEQRLQQLTKTTEDRQTRVETAIYQVARQVDLLDARLREEQDNSLRALEAVLSAHGTPSGRAL